VLDHVQADSASPLPTKILRTSIPLPEDDALALSLNLARFCFPSGADIPALLEHLDRINEAPIHWKNAPSALRPSVLSETHASRYAFTRPAHVGSSALIYAELQHCALCGFGTYFLLTRTDTGWGVVGECQVWAS